MDAKLNSFNVDWPPGKFKVDFHELFEDIKFKNLTDDITFREIQLLEYYESMESYIKLIMTSLEEELKTK